MDQRNEARMMPLVHPYSLRLLRERFPEVDQGSADARANTWRDVEGDYESMAYEVGRLLVSDPPGTTTLGLLDMSPFLATAFKQLVSC